LVIRYSYLWLRQARLGREEGEKTRPCAVILVVLDEIQRARVRVLPITHSPPHDRADALELPPATKQRLGLDAERSWVILNEANDFLWPGPDLRFLPGQGPESVVIGRLPPGFLNVLRERLEQRRRERRLLITNRTE
jgi:hypothetical protein